MKTMKLHDVEAITKVSDMTLADAAKYVSPNQARIFTRNQALALSLMTWRNTSEDWLRLQACLIILRNKAAR